ncbi:MAG: hypothetical protein AAGF81_12550 [Pseudomonadota bacterium]
MDGELDAATKAEVAAAVAADAKLARKVAQLSLLKAALPEAMPEMPELVETAGKSSAAPSESTTNWRNLAASLAVFVLVGCTVAGVLVWQSLVEDSSSWHLQAKDIHSQWAVNPTTASELHSVSNDSPVVGVDIPDLSSARLAISRLQRVRLGDHLATHVGYVGTRGCRVSLFIFHDEQLSQPASAGLPAGMRKANWRAGRRSYLILSTGMDVRRFTQLASSIKAFTRDPNLLDQSAKQQLAEARRTSRACVV